MKEGGRLGPYGLEQRIASSPIWTSWRGSAPDGTRVFIKTLDLGTAPDWKAIDAIAAEVNALRGISHPGIPKFIEAFETEDTQAEGIHRLSVIVTEFVEGENLKRLVDSGRRFTEDEIVGIVIGMAGILDYLESLRPPVAHRDVNPKNIILRADGSVSLVDFSGAREAVRLNAWSSSTMLGTAGYMPIEQLSGRASVRSDRYSLAATAIFLLTRKEPSEIPLADLKPDWESLTVAGPGLTSLISNWIEPDEKDRGITPAEAIALLKGGSPAGVPAKRPADKKVARRGRGEPSGTRELGLPSDSRIRIEEGEDFLEIEIPRRKAGAELAALGTFFTFFVGFAVFWTILATALGGFFGLFGIPFIVIGTIAASKLIKPYFMSTRLCFSGSTLAIERGGRRGGRISRREYPLSDIGRPSLKGSNAKGNSMGNPRELSFEAGASVVSAGSGYTERELKAVAAAMNRFLETRRPS